MSIVLFECWHVKVCTWSTGESSTEASGNFCEEQGLFSCKDRWDTCVENSKACDGSTDCYNGYDEDNCG